MHHVVKIIPGTSGVGDQDDSPAQLVPMPGYAHNLHELPVGEYLLYEASGKLTKDECQGAEVTEGTLPPRTFKYEKRIAVSEDGKYRTL